MEMAERALDAYRAEAQACAEAQDFAEQNRAWAEDLLREMETERRRAAEAVDAERREHARVMRSEAQQYAQPPETAPEEHHRWREALWVGRHFQHEDGVHTAVRC